ncbi:hypothetical protein E2C01_045867 [Portunus trituberculatus]|uniref:Uncharacterized protein n=1 Tax=Portunus trituberculatus TaxID=210409 RepID=A0A5B7G4A0_PORTR|nr:hypothetical protein [Portunus trituberculatus]
MWFAELGMTTYKEKHLTNTLVAASKSSAIEVPRLGELSEGPVSSSRDTREEPGRCDSNQIKIDVRRDLRFINIPLLIMIHLDGRSEGLSACTRMSCSFYRVVEILQVRNYE